MAFDYAAHKAEWHPMVPTKQHRMAGIYPKNPGNGRGLFYWAGVDPARVKKGMKAAFTVTCDNYWEACEQRLAHLQKMAGPAEIPQALKAILPPQTDYRADARGRMQPVVRRTPEARQGEEISVSAVLGLYEKRGVCPLSQVQLVRALANKLEGVALAELSTLWALRWVAGMKVTQLKPRTIRASVEQLSRVLEWFYTEQALKKATAAGGGLEAEARAFNDKPRNPLKDLPKGYSTYKPEEVPKGQKAPKDIKRDRRLFDGEYETIRKAISELKVVHADGDPAKLEEDKWGLDVLFELIVNSAMRMSEAFALHNFQLHFMGSRSSIILPEEVTKTSNGRSIPMTPHVQAILKKWMARTGAPKGAQAPVFPMFHKVDREDYFTFRKEAGRMSQLFIRVHKKAGIVGLREHDLRHEGTCRWVEMKLANGRHAYQLAECMKFTGHETEAMFFRYASLRGSDAAERLYEGQGEALAA